MSDLKICRICLRTQCKMYKYDLFQLKPYYEEVMAIRVNDKDDLPQYFCYECATMLHKFHKFKEKCYTGQQTLKEISWRGSISYEAVYNIDRTLKKLKSPLGILTVNERVKTYVGMEVTITDSGLKSIHFEDEREVILKDDSDRESVLAEDFKEVNIKDDSDSESIQAEDEKEISIKDIEDHVYLNEGSLTDDHFSDEDTKDDIAMEENIVLKEINDTDKTINNDEIDDKVNDKDPSSPTTIFVDVKKDALISKSELSKKRKHDRVKPNTDFSRNKAYKSRYLDTKYWKKITLTEEEAVKEFQLKAKSHKYVNAAFKCEHCLKGFSKEEMLLRHRQLRHNERQFALACRFCHVRYRYDCKLRRHMREHFTRFKCLRCSMKCCSENTAILHDECHKGVIKKCAQCGESFKHSSTYYTHLRTHRSEYICTLCGKSFVSPLGLHMHKKIKHVTDEIESPDDDEEVNTFCEKCDIRFETRKAYEEHLFHSTMHTEGVEDEASLGQIPRKVLGPKTKAKITRSLKRNKPLDEDVQYKDGRRRKRRCYKKPTTCHQCGKHFETQAACLRHHIAEHPGTSFFADSERHICEICGSSLAPGSVTMHQNMHTKQKVYPCENCGKTFHSTVGLKRHSVTHTGEKPFACSLCDKRFTQSNSMKLHYRTFHLKQPYPKRNRRKKKDDPPDVTEKEDKLLSSSDESEVSAEPRPRRRIEPATTQSQDSIHYLTLS